MALTPDYTTASEIKTRLGIGDTVDDSAIGAAVTAASRLIDEYTRRQFGQEDSDSTRLYAITSDVVAIDDLQSTPTSVGTLTAFDASASSTALTATDDYRLVPLNAAAEGKPWTGIQLSSGAMASTSSVRNPYEGLLLEVVGSFGWTAVPDAVAEAAALQAIRIFKRSQAPFGIAGASELGGETRLLAQLDPDVKVMLTGLRRRWGATGARRVY